MASSCSIIRIFLTIITMCQCGTFFYVHSTYTAYDPLNNAGIYDHYYNDHDPSLGPDGDPFHHSNTNADTDFTEEWAKLGTRIRKPRCVKIPEEMSLCDNIGYKNMTLPNFLNHDDMEEVIAQSKSWVPLVNINCHPDTRVFLCSLFSPVCMDRMSIYPCRSLCEDVHRNCIGRMKFHNYDWPEMLRCDKFPEDNDMCIHLQNKVIPDNNCSACRDPLTYESIVDHFCRADVVMKVTVKGFNDLNRDRELLLRKKKKLYKSDGINKRVARRLRPVILGGQSCVCNTINKTQERYLIMGSKKDDKLLIKFGIPWNKRDKEFKRGFKAIRRSETCESILKDLSQNVISNGGDVTTPDRSSVDKSSKRKGNKKKGKGKKGKKGKGKKKGKKGKKGKRRKGKGKGKGKRSKRGRRKNRKNKGRRDSRKSSSSSSSSNTSDKLALEKQALDTFRIASN